MTEEQGAPQEQEEQAPQAPESTVPEGTGDVEEGKAFAVLSYALSFVGIPFFLVPLIMRNNTFALYHAKQCLILWLGGIAVAIVSMLLSFVCIGIIIGPVLGILLLVLCILALVNASKGVMEPVPVIGKWGEEWFKGLTKIH